MAMSFDPFTELDRLTGALTGMRQGPRVMPVDLYRDGDRYVLNADMPGIDPGSVDVDVDRPRIDARHVGVEHVAVAVAIEVDRHDPGPLSHARESPGEAVELGERIERHGHDEESPFG